MVDSESYVVQERELHKRLPNVSLEVIKYFLTRYHGNVEECYQKLRVITPQPLSPEMDPFKFYERTSTVSTSRPTQYDPPPSLPALPPSSSPYLPQPQQYHQQQHGPQTYQHAASVEPPPPSSLSSPYYYNRHHNDQHRMVKRQLTWEPQYAHTLPHPRRHQHTTVQQPPLDPHHQYSISSGGYGHHGPSGQPHPQSGGADHYKWNQYETNDSQSRVNNLHLNLPPPTTWTTSLPRFKQTMTSTNSSSSGLNPAGSTMAATSSTLVGHQQRQLDDLHRYYERQFTHLTLLRQQIDDREQSLSRLRMQVSAIPSQDQMGELKEVIQTLEIDLREARNSLQVQQVQSKMKKERDIYTDEGERWYCEDCNFLNHPLMTLCEKCDIPRSVR